MNITPSLIYWITRLDNICNTFTVLAFILLIGSLVATIGVIAYCAENHVNEKTSARYYRNVIISWICCIFCFLGSIFIPSTKEMAAIYVIPAVANNEKVQALTENSLDCLIKLTNQWAEEKLAPKTDCK